MLYLWCHLCNYAQFYHCIISLFILLASFWFVPYYNKTFWSFGKLSGPKTYNTRDWQNHLLAILSKLPRVSRNSSNLFVHKWHIPCVFIFLILFYFFRYYKYDVFLWGICMDNLALFCDLLPSFDFMMICNLPMNLLGVMISQDFPWFANLWFYKSLSGQTIGGER